LAYSLLQFDRLGQARAENDFSTRKFATPEKTNSVSQPAAKKLPMEAKANDLLVQMEGVRKEEDLEVYAFQLNQKDLF